MHNLQGQSTIRHRKKKVFPSFAFQTSQSLTPKGTDFNSFHVIFLYFSPFTISMWNNKYSHAYYFCIFLVWILSIDFLYKRYMGNCIWKILWVHTLIHTCAGSVSTFSQHNYMIIYDQIIISCLHYYDQKFCSQWRYIIIMYYDYIFFLLQLGFSWFLYHLILYVPIGNTSFWFLNKRDTLIYLDISPKAFYPLWPMPSCYPGICHYHLAESFNCPFPLGDSLFPYFISSFLVYFLV